MNLKHLTDKSLLIDTKDLARQYRTVTTKLLHHLKEIDRRKLFSDLGYPSLFIYVVKELGFSEASAIRRIKAARLLEEIPEIEAKIEAGTLNLSNLEKAANAIKANDIQEPARKIEIIEAVENVSSNECIQNLSEVVPPPPMPLEIPKHKMRFLSIAIGEETESKFSKIKHFLAHRKLSNEKLFEVIFEKALLKIEEEMFKTNSKRSSSEPSNSRYIPAAIRKAVYLRDKHCTNCQSTYALEFEHIVPFSMGGKTSLENLKLLCRNCNQRSRITQKLSPRGTSRRRGYLGPVSRRILHPPPRRS